MLLVSSITQDFTTKLGKIKTVTITQSQGTTTTDTPSTASINRTTLVTSPAVSKMLLASSITQDFTTTPRKNKTKKTTQSLGTATTDTPSTPSKTTTTLLSSPTVSKMLLVSSITQDFTTKLEKIKTVTITQSQGTTTTDTPSTASINRTTLVTSPAVSKMLLASSITQDFTTTPRKNKTKKTTQSLGTTTTDTPSTASKSTKTLLSSQTVSKMLLANKITQDCTTTPRNTKTVTTTQFLGTTSTDISSTASKKTTAPVSSPTISKLLLATDIIQDFTTTPENTKTVTITQFLGTTSTDIKLTASKKMSAPVSSQTISKLLLATDITQDFTTTAGNTKTVTTTQDIDTKTTDIKSTASKKNDRSCVFSNNFEIASGNRYYTRFYNYTRKH